MIHMQTFLQDIKLLCGIIPNNNHIPALQPFSYIVCHFLSDLSKELMKSSEARAYSDVLTFAFFCRKANVSRLKKEYEGKIEGRIGRGLIFHIAPSNVPVIFAYSLVSSLLAGNASLVKASSKGFVQTDIITEAMNDLLGRDDYSALKSYITVITYPRDNKDATDFFSALCDVRVIWGGDKTVFDVRKSQLKPRSFDLTFADRYSLAIIDAESIRGVKEAELKKLAEDFYNDTYLYDQNACTSPRLVYWIGKEDSANEARHIFWDAVYNHIKDKYVLQPSIAVDKIDAECRAAIELDCAAKEEIFAYDNRIVLVKLNELSDNIQEIRASGGYYYECIFDGLDNLKDIVDERYQAVGVYGITCDVVSEFVLKNGLHGIDRIRPIGHLADFELTWDGYDLIETLSRKLVW